jgi:murein DD-endopeptidase MepM/ murein hydrolase activator NlpD
VVRLTSPLAGSSWFLDGALGVLAVLLLGGLVSLDGPAVVGPLSVAHPKPRRAPVEAVTARRELLGTGETLAQLGGRLGMTQRELIPWLAEAAHHLNMKALPVGLAAEALVGDDGRVRSLRLTPDWRADIILERSAAGITGRRQERPVRREIVIVRGSIESSLFGALDALGETDDLAVAVADLFSWDIDFHRDLQPGDSFAVLVERVRAEGRTVAYGPVLAATFANNGKSFAAYRYVAEKESPGYYDAAGSPTRKLFLRAPLRFTRVTSAFSRSRMHPILGRRVPHWGVDYGAPIGTPVMATATGTVVSRGWRGGGGNAVELRHPGGFTTAYLHLSRFAASVKPGARVEQGQVVGYVGTTGMSTGPHLDYRVTKNGAPINPATIGHEPAPPLPKLELARFVVWRDRLSALLQQTGTVAPATWATVRAAAPAGFGG